MSAEQVRLRFVGSGDAFGNGGRFQTCFWLEGGPDSLLIDCGATSLTALKAAGLEPNEIACVVLTHLHGDHFGGLPFLVLDGSAGEGDRGSRFEGPPAFGRAKLRRAGEHDQELLVSVVHVIGRRGGAGLDVEVAYYAGSPRPCATWWSGCRR